MMRKHSFFLTFFMLCLSGVVAAQDMAACAALTADRIQTAASACAGRGLNTVCIGSNPAHVGLSGGEVEFLPGDTLALDLVRSVTTGAANSSSDEWGMALLSTDAGLSAGLVSMVLFGDAKLTSNVSVLTPDLSTLTISNTAGYDVNLREGPGTTFLTTGTFPQNTTLTVDGRSADGQWLRVRTADGNAWVSLSLVQVDGNPTTLASLDSLYTSPMQAFTLDSAGDGTDLCGVDLSGMLVSYSGEERAHLVFNGVNIAFSAATLLLQANATSGLHVYVLEGDVQATFGGQLVGANTGGSISSAVNPDTLVAEGGGQSQGRYPFTAVGGAPLDLVAATSLECVAGVTGVGDVTPYSGPGQDYSPLARLDSTSHYTVTGFAADTDGQLWWKLENNRWIPQNAVQTAGLCQSIARVNAPLMSQITVVPGMSMIPVDTTIYQAESGPDVLTGQCVLPPLAICSHPAAIKPNDGASFFWRGQEPVDYLMSPAGDNTYSYSGRNFANNGTVNLTLKFNGSDGWTMTMATLFDGDPQCMHTFYYTATRR